MRVAHGPRRTGAGSNGLTWPHPANRVVLDDYLLAINQLEVRLMELDARLATVATTDPYRGQWAGCGASGASTR